MLATLLLQQPDMRRLLVLKQNVAGSVNCRKLQIKNMRPSVIQLGFCKSCSIIVFFFCLCVWLSPRSTSVYLDKCIRPSVAFGCPTWVQETTRSEWEPSHWLATAHGHTLWISMWLKVRRTHCHAPLKLFVQHCFIRAHKCSQNNQVVYHNRIRKCLLRCDLYSHLRHLLNLLFGHNAGCSQQEKVRAGNHFITYKCVDCKQQMQNAN